MLKEYSFNREFDFVRLEGLGLVTGRPPHEWDIYIIKELLDNALDADDDLWRSEGKPPAVDVEIEYVRVPEHGSSQLHVRVTNQAQFPTSHINDIFDPQWYTSRKAFVKGLTRGALGNALKTVLGIPYSLRDRSVGDWRPDLKPMVIQCGSTQYRPQFIVDSITQTIRTEIEREEKPSEHVDGTRIAVGMDHFQQEVPRTLNEIKNLAERYRLCNPQVGFTWVVEIDQEAWRNEFPRAKAWNNKFLGRAPVQWYARGAFKDLLSVMYREHCSDRKDCTLPVKVAFHEISAAGSQTADSQQLDELIKSLGASELSAGDIQEIIAVRFHQLLCQLSPAFDSAQLGAIGQTYLSEALKEIFPVEQELTYHSIIDDGSDPSVPFVIEGALAELQTGTRQLVTATNFAPSYEDLFRSAPFESPVRPGEKVKGLRELLDVYDLNEDVPVILFLHLISPSIERYEFSKTEINHLPFAAGVTGLIDRLVSEFQAKRKEQESKIEGSIFLALDAVIEELAESERFVFDQLIEKLRVRLSLDTSFAAWLEKPDSLVRLQTHINSYQSRTTVLSHRVARPGAGSLSLPRHPTGYITVASAQASRELLANHFVNKLLYVQIRELEPVVIDNNWLSTIDAALLCNPSKNDDLRQAIVQCLTNSDLPIAMLHDADEKGSSVVIEIRDWLSTQQLDSSRIIDVGLRPPESKNQPAKLVEMMPNELLSWIRDRFKALRIPIKYMPEESEVRSNVGSRFENLLLGHIWDGVSQTLQLANLLDSLDQRFNFTQAMHDQHLDRALRHNLEEDVSGKTYAMMLDDVVAKFFEEFMARYAVEIQASVKDHLEQLRVITPHG